MFCECFGVGEYLSLVGFEVGGLSLFECNGESGDGVVVRVILMIGKDSVVDGVFEVVYFILFGFGVLFLDIFVEEDYGILWVV